MSKFRCGEIVIYVGPEFSDRGEPIPWVKGQELEIAEVMSINDMPSFAKRSCQWYRVGADEFVSEHCLRNRPDDQPFSEWFRNTIITDPIAVPGLETTMRNVARNLQKFTEAERGS